MPCWWYWWLRLWLPLQLRHADMPCWWYWWLRLWLGQGLAGGLKCLLDFLFGGGDLILREFFAFGGGDLGLVITLVTCEGLDDQMMLQLASRT
jgi:hypothetical protein